MTCTVNTKEVTYLLPNKSGIMWTLQVFMISNFLFFANAKMFRCDYDYVESINGWLKLHRIPANWHEARLRCHMEGATLASPLRSEHNQAMTKLMVSEKLNCPVFTGIHAIFSRGDLASVEGVRLDNIPHTWAPGEPDNFKDEESCIILLNDGTIADAKCADVYAYFCYKEDTKTMVMNNCGTDPEYTYEPRTGSCYKFHSVPRTWSRAYMACMAERGHLAIINSEVEAQVIKDLFAKHPPNSMLGNFWKEVAFVGYHDWNEHGDWRTIHGQTLHEAGYAKWSGGEPNNSTTGEFCGSVYRNSLYDDIWCENHYAFICEKKPGNTCLKTNQKPLARTTTESSLADY